MQEFILENDLINVDFVPNHLALPVPAYGTSISTKKKNFTNVLSARRALLSRVLWITIRGVAKSMMFKKLVLTFADFALNLLQENITVICMRKFT